MNTLTLSYGPQFWDKALALPLIAIIGLSLMSMFMVLTSPRVFRNRLHRFLVSIALVLYIALMIHAGIDGTSGRWRADIFTFIRFGAQALPSALAFWVMWKLEHMNTDRPFKAPPWAVC